MGKSTKAPKSPEAPASTTVSGFSHKENRLDVPFIIYNWYLPLSESNIHWGALAKREHIVCLVQDKNKDDILNTLTKYGILKFLEKEHIGISTTDVVEFLNNSSAETPVGLLLLLPIPTIKGYNSFWRQGSWRCVM